MTIDYSRYEGHTEGPWHVVEDCTQQDELGYGPTGVAISKYSDDVVDAIAWMQEGNDQDAKLLADAPMLLQRCRELEAAIEQRQCNIKSKPLLCCDPTFDEPLLPRELDEYVARDLLGWQATKVGADACGENECEILTPDGKLPEGVDLPRKGKVGAAYLVPEYSRGLQHAIGLASRFGFDRVTIQTNELSFKIPELIVRCVIGAVSSTTKEPTE